MTQPDRHAERLAGEQGVTRAILDASPDGILMIDREGTVVFANHVIESAFASTLGIEPVGARHDDLIERIAPLLTDPGAYLAANAAISADPELSAVHEYAFVQSRRCYRRYTTPVRADGDALIGRIFILHDITQEQEAERVKSDLLNVVSHELRTPLAGILGFTELLTRPELGIDTRKRYAETIHAEARRLTELVDNVLDLQRIEQGTFAFAHESFDLVELLRWKLELYSGQSDTHSLELVLPEQQVIVHADREQLGHVVGNLLSNAIKYSPGGGPVTLEVERTPDAVRVLVRDEGIGVPPRQHDRLFRKFSRAESEASAQIGGSGLGLALAREIVEAHGGQIDFESREGVGSTFWFELPA